MSDNNNNSWRWAGFGIPLFLAALAAIFKWLSEFDSSRFLPHAMCLLRQPDIIVTEVSANAIIAFSYFAIPAQILYVYFRQRNLSMPPMNFLRSPQAILFAVFILGCGTTHVMDVITIWAHPYWADAFIRVLTALASVATVISLHFALGHLVGEPSVDDLLMRIKHLEAQKKD